MKKVLMCLLVFLGCVCFASMTFAQATYEAQPFGGKLKIEGYAEYIKFNESDLDSSAWGGGVLARYLFLDWLGVQTNFTIYTNTDPKKLSGDLSFRNLRLAVILHTYINGLDGPMPLYVYGGGGPGIQFNSDVHDIHVKDAITGNVIGGIGYDFSDHFNIEAEVGYQFGDADVSNYRKSKIGVDAMFVRFGIGARF